MCLCGVLRFGGWGGGGGGSRWEFENVSVDVLDIVKGEARQTRTFLKEGSGLICSTQRLQVCR